MTKFAVFFLILVVAGLIYYAVNGPLKPAIQNAPAFLQNVQHHSDGPEGTH